MKNFEVAKVLREIALFLEMDDVQYRPRAYEKAALSVEALEEEVEEIYRKGGIDGLQDIPGVGQSIAKKIEELINTGKLGFYEDLRLKVPVDLEGLSSVQGVGPKTIKVLWRKLKIRNIDDLEKAARAHRIRGLPGFKDKTEQNILKGIRFARRSRGRFILGFVLPLVRNVSVRLASIPEVKQVVVAGSIRRMKETVGDADFLVISNKPGKVMDFFTSMPEVVDVTGKGETKSSVKLENGMNADVRVLSEESFGSALQYFTGNKDHNIALRRIAREKSLKLSEYGLFRGDVRVAGESEEEVYQQLGLQWVPPELRQNTGEIEAAKTGCLPELVGYDELKGDLQVHSKWTDGANSIRDMAEEAKRLGLEYIVISDHSKSLAMAGGLNVKLLRKQAAEIERVNREVHGITVLKGVEVDILKDGRLDLDDEVLGQLDFVGAAVHSHFNLDKEEMTRRVVRAVENPHVDLLCHPTTRQIQRRDALQLDLDQVLDAAKSNGTFMDVDSYPDRLDLKDELVREAVERGVKVGISSDAHSTLHFRFLELGLAQARRGWATTEDVVNTKKLSAFLKAIKDKP